jgi:esterase/lipase
MSDYSKLIAAIAEASQNREDALPLIGETSRSLFWFHPNPTAKVFLFFHGFTATPAQFHLIGRTLFEAGYNVLVPLLPGHGLAGNWNGQLPPPLPEDQQIYKQFGREWLQQVQGLGTEVLVGGLSGGGTLAAWLALEYSRLVGRALLFAPYFSNTNIVVDWVVRNLDIYFKWKAEPGVIHYGYPGFHMPSLRAFLNMGQEVLERSRSSRARPMLILLSDKDASVKHRDLRQFFMDISQWHPNTWFHCFDKVFDMPHTMMTKVEGNDCVDLLLAVTKAYVESDLTWAEVQTIRDRLAQGQRFDQVIAELNLTTRTSPDVLTLVSINHS